MTDANRTFEKVLDELIFDVRRWESSGSIEAERVARAKRAEVLRFAAHNAPARTTDNAFKYEAYCEDCGLQKHVLIPQGNGFTDLVCHSCLRMTCRFKEPVTLHLGEPCAWLTPDGNLQGVPAVIRRLTKQRDHAGNIALYARGAYRDAFDAFERIYGKVTESDEETK